MTATTLCILIYDVVDDRRRDRLHGLLKQFGHAVQYSAFEARLTKAERRRLWERAARIVDPATDTLILYPIASRQEERIQTLGRPRQEVVEKTYFIM